ncbi:MAG: PHP domain-containing protein [Lachnospiraceae bacterium]|nr:PHP domain-containing protein [Lachnospiraceae bacterium]
MIDMHIHTTISDGDYDSSVIIDYFKKHGGKFIALTDHDVVNKECKNGLIDDNLMSVRGIELTTDYSGGMHILGYGIDDSQVLDIQLKRIKASYVKAMLQLIKRIELELGIELKNIDISKITRHELASILVENGMYNDVTEAYDMVLSYEKYNIKKPLTLLPEMAIKKIHDANGIAILAHPYKNKNITHNTINVLKEIGLDGIECFHPSCTKNEVEQLVLFARNNNLLISGGSDFHSGKLSDLGKNIDYNQLTIIKELEGRFL